jgi:chemotaxis signal transduction protein
MNEALSTAQRLREDFDRSYAEAPPGRVQGEDSLLALSLGGEPYALRVQDIARLAAGTALTPLPSAPPAFLGLAGLRGELLPAWDLGAVLGYAPLRGKPRWLASSASTPRWAAAFERFDGYLKAPREDLSPFVGEGRAQGLAVQLCCTGGLLRPVLSFDKLLQAIRKGEM